MLGWSATELADRSGLSYSTVQRAETEGTSDMRVRNLQAIQETLENTGVVFLHDGKELPGGDGVRLKGTA